MPYISPTLEDVELLKKQQLDPSLYLVDADTDQLVPKDSVPSLSGVEQLKEFAKGIGAGAMSLPSGIARLAGTTADAIRQQTGDYNPADPSAFTQAAEGIDAFTNRTFPQDPRGWVAGGVGRAGGQIADALLTGGLARKGAGSLIRHLTTPTSAMVGSGLITTAGSVADRELERQLREKEAPSSAAALGKGLAVAGITLPVEQVAGMGALGKLLEGGSGQSIGKTILKQAGLGAGQDTVEQAAEDTVVEGKTTPEALIQAATIGAIAQGAAGGGIQALAGSGLAEVKSDLTAEYEANKAKAAAESAKATPTAQFEIPSDEKAYSIFTRAQAAGKYDPPGNTEVDDTINEATKRKLLTSPRDVQDIHEMHNLSVPQEKILRTLFDRMPADVAATLEGDLPVVERLSDEDIQRHIDMDPETKLPFGNPLTTVLDEARGKTEKTGRTINSIQDYRRVEQAFHSGGNKEADAISKAKAEVDRIFMEKQALSAPKRAAEAAKAIEERRWNFFQKDFPERVKAIKAKQKAVADVEKQLSKIGITSSQFRTLSANLAATAQSLEGDVQALVGELSGNLNRANVVPPAAGPTAMQPTGQPVDPQAELGAELQAALEEGQGLPISRGPINVQAGNPAAADMARLLDMTRGQPDPDTAAPIKEDEQGRPFGTEVVPGSTTVRPAPENEAQITEQLRLTSDKNSTKAATLITPGSFMPVSMPVGLKGHWSKHGLVVYNPIKISEVQVKRATFGDVVDARILGMAAGTDPRPGTKMVTTSNQNATDVVGEIVRNEGEANAAAQAQQAAVPGGKTEVKEASEVLEDRTEPKIYYSGLPNFGKALGWSAEQILKFPYRVLRSANMSLANSQPAGAYLAGIFPELEGVHRSIANPLIDKLKPHVEAVKNPVFRQWLVDVAGSGKDGIAVLPKSLQPAGRAYRDVLKSLHDVQRKENIGVTDSVTGKKRQAKDDPSYAALGPDKAVREAFSTFGDPRQKAYTDDFNNNWRKYDSKSGWQDRAAGKMKSLLAMGADAVKSNNPEFAAVREAQGVPLPPSWRAADAYEGIIDHINKASRDIAWGKVVEHRPAARRALGMTTDPMGVDTEKTDPKTWKEAPEAWKLAVREGKRTGAKWAEGMDENNPPDEVIELRKDADGAVQNNYDTILRSFNQQNIHGGASGAATAVAAASNQLAGSLVMQLSSGIRDAATSVQLAYQKAGVWDTIKGVADGVVRPLVMIERAREQGATPMDLTAAEMADTGNAVANGIYKAAKGIRKISGRNFLDSWGRSLIYNVMNDVIASGKGKGLLEEYGPAGWEKMPLPEAASKTAALMAERESNTSTAMNLPAFMVPQNNTAAGALFRLSNWGIGSFNHFMEDIVIPLRRGDRVGAERLMRMAIGGTMVGTLVTSLTNWLADRKPEHLTWAEWMKLPDDPQKLKEFFYTLTGYNQGMGTMAGVLNDYVLLPASRAATGGEFFNTPGGDLNPQMPAWIVGKQWFDAVNSFVKSPITDSLDVRDLSELGLEMLKANQMAKPIGRVLAAAGVEGAEEEFGFGKQRLGREERMFERLTGLDVKTGEEATEPAGVKQPFKRDPFSASNMAREANGEVDWRKLEPYLEDRAKKGSALRLPGNNRSKVLFQEIGRRRGMDEARALAEEAIREEEDTKRRNRVIKKLEKKGR